MGELKQLRTCPGCGAEIQFEHPGRPGFIPPEVFDRRLKEGKELLCQRCFRLKHYSSLTSEVDEEELEKVLKHAIGTFRKFIYVFDLSDFEGTFRPEILKLIKNSHVFLVANKYDTLPRTVGPTQLRAWLTERIGFLTELEGYELFITSTLTGYGISRFSEFLKSQKGKAMVLGVTNVGKSSLLKRVAHSEVTVSPYPGTTIGLVEHRVGGLRLFDTPGIIVDDRLIDLFDASCQAKIFADGGITRMTFKPDPDETIFIGGLVTVRARLERGEGGELKPIFQIFAPERVTFHKTSNPKFFQNVERHFGDLLVPPCGRFELSRIKLKTVELVADKSSEVCVPGLCWINVKRGPVRFEVTAPENVNVQLRPALMKPKRFSQE